MEQKVEQSSFVRSSLPRFIVFAAAIIVLLVMLLAMNTAAILLRDRIRPRRREA